MRSTVLGSVVGCITKRAESREQRAEANEARTGVPRVVRCLALTLLVLTGLAMTSPAHAQTVEKLVGNAEQSNAVLYPLVWNEQRGIGQSFTTGNEPGGYFGDHIRLSLAEVSGAINFVMQAKLYTCASDGLRAGTHLTNLQRYGSLSPTDWNYFHFPDDYYLSPNTCYGWSMRLFQAWQHSATMSS